MPNVVFIGASRFGLRCLAEVEKSAECRVAGIVTAPREFRISYRPQGVINVLHADFSAYARERGIPCVTMTGKMTDPEILAAARGWRPDLFIVVGWYHLIPKALREIAPAVGMHASLLPEYCGGAPLVWAMINGEKETGITLFQLGDGVDDGPIIAQAAEPIRDDDTIATLYARIEERGLELLRAQLPLLVQGKAVGVPQDAARRRMFPQRSPEDGIVDWTWPARRVYDFVRAQTRPYPGAFTRLRGERLTLWRVEPQEQPLSRLKPGTLSCDMNGGEGPRVACGDSRSVLLREVEWNGATLSGARFSRQICDGRRRLVEHLG